MTTTSNLISKIVLVATTLTFGAAGVAMAHPGHGATSANPLLSARPAALVAQNGNAPAKMKGEHAKELPSKARDAKAKTFERRQARHAEKLAKFDRNGDGKLNRAEHQIMKGKHFAELDANGDGAVTLAEMQEARKQRRAAKQQQVRMKKLERAANKQRRAKRGAAMQAQRFAKLDQDGNGSLSEAEFVLGKGKGKSWGKGKGKGKAAPVSPGKAKQRRS